MDFCFITVKDKLWNKVMLPCVYCECISRQTEEQEQFKIIFDPLIVRKYFIVGTSY